MPSIIDYLAGYTNQGEMRDFEHATRLYVDNLFALAPKTSWIYYVVFSINPAAISEVQWKNQRRDYEAGMLVKACDLPKFQIQTETLNQYNRKTNVQTKITYQPISFAFHDDQSNVTNSLWVNYFRYYYRDTWHGQNVGMTSEISNKPFAYKNNKYEAVDSYPGARDGRPGTPGTYGLNNNQSVPFFNAITIYQLNQKRFTSYVIVNPLITSWEHDHLDQTNGGKFAENKMTIAYETVFYGEGRVRRDSPSGFATFHYDITPSPLSISGGGTNTVFGPGGIIAGVEDIFGAQDGLLSRGLSGNPLNLLGAGIAGANLLKNSRDITRESLRAEGQSILNSALQGIVAGGAGGLTGILNGGLGAVGASLGFGQTGTLLAGANFVPNSVVAGAYGGPESTSLLSVLTTPQASQVSDALNPTEVINNASAEQLSSYINDASTQINTLQSQLESARALQAEVSAKVEAARASEGSAAADAVYKEYVTSQGYQDPVKIEGNIQAYQAAFDRLVARRTSLTQ